MSVAHSNANVAYRALNDHVTHVIRGRPGPPSRPLGFKAFDIPSQRGDDDRIDHDFTWAAGATSRYRSDAFTRAYPHVHVEGGVAMASDGHQWRIAPAHKVSGRYMADGVYTRGGRSVSARYRECRVNIEQAGLHARWRRARDEMEGDFVPLSIATLTARVWRQGGYDGDTPVVVVTLAPGVAVDAWTLFDSFTRADEPKWCGIYNSFGDRPVARAVIVKSGARAAVIGCYNEAFAHRPRYHGEERG